ncbi:MAG TPA: hypothetical protein VK391_07680 [Allosphingosinicella sp.]|nr:hypothetical protein [Allosphingosinicella sp.]
MSPSDEADEDMPPADTPAEAVIGGVQRHALARAAIVGGAIAAGAGAYLGTRAMARRSSGRRDGKVNSVMAAAITACDVGKKPQQEPTAEEIVITPPSRA